MKTISFENFGSWSSGRVVSSDNRSGDTVVFHRNPYGRHNLVLVYKNTAYVHGNAAVLRAIAYYDGRDSKVFRRAARFLAERGLNVNHLVNNFN